MSKGLQLGQANGVWPSELLAALDAYEKVNASGSPDVQDSFVIDAYRALSFEPLTAYPFHPEAWKKINAGLDINVRLTSQGQLAIEASPWEEDSYRMPSGHWRFEDFAIFPGEDNIGARPKASAFDLTLEELAPELRDPNMKVDPEGAYKRKLVFACYQFVLQRLSVHFKCRIQTGLVSLGTQARLLLRKMTVAENPVEQANLLPGGHSVRWHTRYLALCEKAGVSPDELLAFYKKSLANVGDTERLSLLADFQGKPRSRYEYRPHGDTSFTRTLLGALTVVANAKAFPPLINHPSEKLEEMFSSIVAHERFLDGASAIANLYFLEKGEIHELLREHYPKVLVASFTHLPDLRKEVEYFHSKEPGAPLVLEALQMKLEDALYEAWEQLPSKTRGVRRRQLASRFGLYGFESLLEWARQYCPQATEWLEKLEPGSKPASSIPDKPGPAAT